MVLVCDTICPISVITFLTISEMEKGCHALIYAQFIELLDEPLFASNVR